MIYWILFLTVLTVLSYLSDVGVLTFFQDIRIPFLDASLLSVLLLLCTLGILVRMLQKRKKGEKESLAARIADLERTAKD